MKYFVLFVCVSLGFSFTTSETKERPVTWEFSTQKIDKSTAYLIMTADIKKGWKIYGALPYLNAKNNKVKCNDNLGPTCLEVGYEEGEVLLDGKVVSTKKALKSYDKVFRGEITYYKDKVVLKQKIKNIPNKKLKGYVYYMTCNDEKCYPPTYVDFDIAFPK